MLTVGKITARTLLARLPELGTLNRQEIAALVGTRVNPTLRVFYERLLKAGKEKIALTARLRKLLVILNAILRLGEPWRTAVT
jgi:transposase